MIRAAEPRDLAGIAALLEGAGLPTDGVDEHLHSFFVEEDRGRLAGVVGLELYGEHALLRSVVVAAAARGAGLGSTLTRRAVDEARARGVTALYLLTTTAEAFFPRFGFERTEREEVPESLRASRELREACPSTAVCMRLDLRSSAV